jgi:PAS domain S-box-containing protein
MEGGSREIGRGEHEIDAVNRSDRGGLVATPAGAACEVVTGRPRATCPDRWRHAALAARWLRQGAANLTVAVACVVAARLGPALGLAHANVSLMWPPTGIALAVLLLFGPRLWPGVAAGAVLINASTGVPVVGALTTAVGSTLEALVGTYLVRHLLDFRSSLGRVRDVFGFVGLGAILSTTLGATADVVGLGGSGNGQWWQWWLGDAIGDLVIAPVLLTWLSRPLFPWRGGRRLEASALFAALGLGGSAIFVSWWAPLGGATYPLAFTASPFMIWAALRLGPRGAATATFVVAGFAVAGVARHGGPFPDATPAEGLVPLQVFIGVVAMTALVLAAVAVQRKRAEDEHRRVASIVESSDDAIIGKTLDGIIQTWNRGAERLYGYRAAEAIGQSMAILMPPEQPNELPEILERVRRGERIDHYEAVRRRRDGTRIDVSVTISPIRESGGRIVGASAIARDITQHKRFEAAAREADALRAVMSLAVAAAHEINNPLAVVRGHLELLGGEEKDQRAGRRIEQMLEQADRIHEIVERMTHITRLVFVEKQRQYLPEMLDLRRASGEPGAARTGRRERPIGPHSSEEGSPGERASHG